MSRTSKPTAAQRRARQRALQRDAVRERSAHARGVDLTVDAEHSWPEVGVLFRVLKNGVQLRLTADFALSTPDRLLAIAHARRLLDTIEGGAVADARSEGASWADIGAALGVSGEAARKRLGKFDPS